MTKLFIYYIDFKSFWRTGFRKGDCPLLGRNRRRRTGTKTNTQNWIQALSSYLGWILHIGAASVLCTCKETCLRTLYIPPASQWLSSRRQTSQHFSHLGQALLWACTSLILSPSGEGGWMHIAPLWTFPFPTPRVGSSTPSVGQREVKETNARTQGRRNTSQTKATG